MSIPVSPTVVRGLVQSLAEREGRKEGVRREGGMKRVKEGRKEGRKGTFLIKGWDKQEM